MIAFVDLNKLEITEIISIRDIEIEIEYSDASYGKGFHNPLMPKVSNASIEMIGRAVKNPARSLFYLKARIRS